jgi:hypothetical protein
MPFPQRLAKIFGKICPKKADACTATTSEMLTKRTYCERACAAALVFREPSLTPDPLA